MRSSLSMTMTKILAGLCLLALAHFASAETGCPDPKHVHPCVCSTYSGSSYLECNGVNDADDLRKVFYNSARYRYKEVLIEYCSLQFLPQDMFKSVTVSALFLKNVTLTQLFDSMPNDLEELRTLHLENTVLLRGILWRLLEPLKGLRILNIYYNVIKSLGREFSESAPKDIEQISLYATETKTLMPGVFAELTKLNRIEVSETKLTALKRDIFPVPFKGQYLYFNKNKISTISNDFFTQMPNLKAVQLRENQITTLPESAFDGNFGSIQNFSLEDNPLKCDCLLKWITRGKPSDLIGKCASPPNLKGREIKDLSPGDFNC